MVSIFFTIAHFKDFEQCRKILLALGDENRQHIFISGHNDLLQSLCKKDIHLSEKSSRFLSIISSILSI